MPPRHLWDGDAVMARSRPKAELVTTDHERAQLTSFASSRSLSASLSARARIVFDSADGEANSLIAERLELGKVPVGKWRSRYIERLRTQLHRRPSRQNPRPTTTSKRPALATTPQHKAKAAASIDKASREATSAQDRPLSTLPTTTSSSGTRLAARSATLAHCGSTTNPGIGTSTKSGTMPVCPSSTASRTPKARATLGIV